MTTYATPVTPTDFANLIALITWPQDCNLQKAAMDRCLDVISALKRGWAAMQPVRLYVGSDTPPGLADWQAAWVDLGYTLPINGSVIGIWETLTDTIKDGGQYAWIENDMRPTLAKWWNGSSEFILSIPSQYSNNAALGASEVALITQTLTLDRAAYVEAAWACVAGNGQDVQYRTSDDAANSTRLYIPLPTGTNQINIFRRMTNLKLTSGTYSQYFRRAGGSNASIIFTNVAVTRKLENGYWGLAAAFTGIVIGEISSLSSEAIYLA